VLFWDFLCLILVIEALRKTLFSDRIKGVDKERSIVLFNQKTVRRNWDTDTEE
jgi:hypothetical protein